MRIYNMIIPTTIVQVCIVFKKFNYHVNKIDTASLC